VADSGLIRICESAALVDGGDGIRFNLARKGAGPDAFVVRHQGRAVAYLNRCAHAGHELDWVPGKFLDHEGRWLICASHGALYEPATGACSGGPCAGRGALVAVPVLEVDGVVYWRDPGGPSA
jgi:nitrite reductase/ring-hydroxylating ferredoxin subunit